MVSNKQYFLQFIGQHFWHFYHKEVKVGFRLIEKYAVKMLKSKLVFLHVCLVYLAYSAKSTYNSLFILKIHGNIIILSLFINAFKDNNLNILTFP